MTKKVKSKHFLALRQEAGDDSRTVWAIFSRTAPETELGTITYTAPDEVQTCQVSLTFPTPPTGGEYAEILTPLNQTTASEKNAVFIQLEKEPFEQDAALASAGFSPDPTDDRFLLWELPVTQWGPIFMCFGISIGMCFGLSVFDNASLGMCFGIPIGLAVGTALTASEKKKREALRKKRAQHGNTM